MSYTIRRVPQKLLCIRIFSPPFSDWYPIIASQLTLQDATLVPDEGTTRIRGLTTATTGI